VASTRRREASRGYTPLLVGTERDSLDDDNVGTSHFIAVVIVVIRAAPAAFAVIATIVVLDVSASDLREAINLWRSW
jgi:hypothetical protein